MRVSKLILREVHMPLVSPFETSMGVSTTRRILLVETVVDGVSGWGEVVAGEDPHFSYETVETAWHVIRDFIWPVLRAREWQAAADLWDTLAHIRGHNMAKAGVEEALWDTEARLKNMPLWKLLGGARLENPCGVSIGIKKNLDELHLAVDKELLAGYRRIKIKIKPGWDVKPVEALRAKHPRILLSVDANCAYTMAQFPLLKELDRFFLMMIEQPLGWDDIYSHRELQRRIETAICLDECITGVAAARAAIEMEACKIINIKIGRVGGHTVVRRIHDLCAEKAVPNWCGGMLESGIGRAHNIALSTLPNFTLPGDVSASARYWTEDIIEPAVTVTPQGTIHVPQGPGIGFEPKVKRIEKLAVRKEVLA
jgi:O-succinylbenzoate synthase